MQLLSGNEAIAQGVWEAGCAVGSGYPGTPSTEALENLVKKDGVYCEWAPNEKVGLEVALGAAMGGVRAFAAMKHVGLNVAADPFMSAANTGVNGGLVLLVADDPSCYSSQNEQDSRYYASFARIPCLDPCDSQEAYEMSKQAFELSERFDTPVMLHETMRVAHTRTMVDVDGERAEVEPRPYASNIGKFVMMPAMAVRRRAVTDEREDALVAFAEQTDLNRVEMHDSSVGVICAGALYTHVREALPEASTLKLGLTWPLPPAKIAEFAASVDKLYVVEETCTYFTEKVRAMGVEVSVPPAGALPRGGEIRPTHIRAAFGLAEPPHPAPAQDLPARPPAFCSGCPHRLVYVQLREMNAIVTGDIGCYTLGFAPPLNCMDVCICMGGGFSAGMGMAKSFQREGVTDKVVFGVMGDSTFFHSGMTGAAEIIYNNGRMIPCVLDNRITGMTGHQDNPGSGYTLMGEEALMISVEKVLEAYGFAPVFTVDPQDLTAMKKTVDDAVAALNEGKHPAIVTRRPCLLIKRVKHDTGMCVVNADKCKSCKSCLKVGCPAISMENGKAFIDRTQCVGCTVCAQACPFDAIEKEEK